MAECCCPEERASGELTGCLLCGEPLVYEDKPRLRICAVCGKGYWADCACRAGHFVCDSCHRGGLEKQLLELLLPSRERCPQRLLEQAMALPAVHMHGPEHHALLPCVLLTAYRNCGGTLELESALRTALKRGEQVPGGACGYWGVCGAAAGAGIYASILTGSSPVNESAWAIPMQLVSRCLQAMAGLGGPRCCKRTCRLAVHEAVAFTAEAFGVDMPEETVACHYVEQNRECLGAGCPYFPG